MRDTIFSALVMAAISSLAFIAYKHPKGFARIYLPLMVAAFSGLLLWMVGSISYTVGFTDASIGYLKLNGGLLKTPERESAPFWVWLLPSAFMIYLQILRILPQILDLLDDEKKKKPESKVDDKNLDA